MELLCRLLILKWHPRKRNVFVPRLKKTKMNFYSLKSEDDELFNNGSKIPAFVIRPLKTILNVEVDRLSL